MYVAEEGGGHGKPGDIVVDAQIVIQDEGATVPPVSHLRLRRRLEGIIINNNILNLMI